jgi:hypothetical protein
VLRLGRAWEDWSRFWLVFGKLRLLILLRNFSDPLFSQQQFFCNRMAKRMRHHDGAAAAPQRAQQRSLYKASRRPAERGWMRHSSAGWVTTIPSDRIHLAHRR